MTEGQHLVIVTGMSGAGRSHAANALEDLGFYVIDNLPANLITQVVGQTDREDRQRSKLAVVVDTRGGLSFDELEHVLVALRTDEISTTLLFLDASDDVLLKRYTEQRRPHPVPAATLSESIAIERAALGDLRGKADVIVDTSDKSVHDLRRSVEEVFAGERPSRPMRVVVTSFGFKHGMPRVADLMFDVRFLPNPHWQPDLQPLTGLDEPVREYVLHQDDATEFMARTTDLLGFVVPRYEEEGKAYLTIAVGCTGGRHRSVAIAEALADWLKGHDPDMEVAVRHRDMGG